jgi:hypothetical protein
VSIGNRNFPAYKEDAFRNSVSMQCLFRLQHEKRSPIVAPMPFNQSDSAIGTPADFPSRFGVPVLSSAPFSRLLRTGLAKTTKRPNARMPLERSKWHHSAFVPCYMTPSTYLDFSSFLARLSGFFGACDEFNRDENMRSIRQNQNRCSLAVYTVNMYTVSVHPPFLSTNPVGNIGIVDKGEVEHPFDRASVRRRRRRSNQDPRFEREVQKVWKI